MPGRRGRVDLAPALWVPLSVPTDLLGVPPRGSCTNLCTPHSRLAGLAQSGPTGTPFSRRQVSATTNTHTYTHTPYTFLGKGKPPKPLSLCWGATAKQAGRTPSARDSSRTHMRRNAAFPHAHTQFRAGSRPQRPPYAASGAGTSAYAVGSPPLASRPLMHAEGCVPSSCSW